MGEAKLAEAEALFAGGMHDGATYLCGYVIEFYLKARICKTLRFGGGYPADKYSFLKTHNLDNLLAMSGMEEKIKDKYSAHWNIVKQWNPENRYDPTQATETEAMTLINAVKKLKRHL